MLREPLSAHPDEWQIWLFRSAWWRSWSAFKSHLLGFVIQGEEWWNPSTGNHMAWRKGKSIVEADWPRVAYASALGALDRGASIEAFAFARPLSESEGAELDAWLADQIGKPYDVLQLGDRGRAAVERLCRLVGASYHPVKPGRDFLQANAFICYELVARGGQAIGHSLGDPNTFGPAPLRANCNRGILVSRGRMVA